MRGDDCTCEFVGHTHSVECETAALPTVRVKAVVRLYCSRPGCPRQKWIARDEGMPKWTAAVMQPCPWHTEEGNKGDGATYWDKDGHELFY